MTPAWQCGVCEGINQGGTTCATCGAVIPAGATPSPAPTVASTPVRPAPPPPAPRSSDAPGALPPRRPPSSRVRRRSGVRLAPAPPTPPPRVPHPTVDPSAPAEPGTAAPALDRSPARGVPALDRARAARAPARGGRGRARSGLVGLLAGLVVLLGWLHSASYAPGLAPRAVAAPPGGADLAVRTDGEDTLLLVPDNTLRGDLPILVDFPEGDLVLEVDRRSQTVWVVRQPGVSALTTIAGRSGEQRVVRVPGPPPGRRWSAQVAGDRLPAEGTSPVEVVPRPFASLTRDPRTLAVAGVGAVLVVLAAARHATLRSVRTSVRSLLFGLLLLPGAPVAARLLQRFASATGWSARYLTAEPALVWVVMALVLPLVALRLAGTVVRERSAAPADPPPPAWVRPFTALLALALLLLAGVLGQTAALRFLPGLVV